MRTHDAKRVVGAVLSLLVVAGCSNEVAGSPIGTGQVVDSNPSSTAPPGTGPSGPPPTPSVPGLPPAEDGSDITACLDGRCTVELRAPVTIPIDQATGVTSLTLESVDDVDGARITGTFAGGGTLSAQLFATPGNVARTVLNGFTIEALATVNGIAVLRMTPP